MSAINSVVLVGRLTRDPELRHTPGGEPVCNFTLAIDRSGDMVDGEIQTGFFDCEVWGNAAENCAQYLAKGRQAGVVGALKHHKWEAQDGTKRSKIYIRAFTVQFLGSKSDRAESTHEDDYAPSAAETEASFGMLAPDADIPF